MQAIEAVTLRRTQIMAALLPGGELSDPLPPLPAVGDMTDELVATAESVYTDSESVSAREVFLSMQELYTAQKNFRDMYASSAGAFAATQIKGNNA